MGKEILKKLLVALLLLYSLYLIIHVSTHRNNYQTDFKIYYYAANASASGLNPYDPNVLFQIAQVPKRDKFTYPPFTLLFFRLFSLVKFDLAFYLFLSFKCLLLIGLIYLWVKKFLQEDRDLLFYIFCFLAFNSTIYLDIIASNISILEQLILWIAFSFFLKRRLLFFCLFIILAAIFKITPILFLFLLWFSEFEKKKKFMYFFSASAIFLVIMLLSYIINPFLFKNFVSNSIGIDERGIINPSTMALIKDAFELLAIKTGVIIPQIIPSILYFVIITTIIIITWRTYRIFISFETKNKEKIAIFLACLVYTLLLPRFKDYSYILLLVPTYFIIKRVSYTFTKVHILLFVFTILSAARVTLPGFDVIFSFFWRYYPLVVAYFVWGLYIYNLPIITKKQPSEAAKAQ